MAIKKLKDGRVVLSNAKYLHVTVWKDEDTIDTTTSYDIVNIVGDTLSFTPDDNTINSKEWEFGDTPLIENVLLGKIQFAATCVDFQNDILKNIFGWTVDGGNAYAPTAYRDIFLTMEIGFQNEDVVIVVPKLKLNSKAVISTMKTGSAEGNLAGTCYAATMAYGAGVPISSEFKTKLKETPMAFLSHERGSTDSNFYFVEQARKTGEGAKNNETDRQFGKFAFEGGVDKILVSPAS